MLCHMFQRYKNIEKEKKEASDNLFMLKEVTKSRSNNWFSQNVLVVKDFHYVLSLIEKCQKFIINADINFKTNPPYLPCILRNFSHKIIDILKCYENKLNELSTINFFRVSIWTLIKQCKEALRIIRNVKFVFDEFSEPRQKLINISILLSHLFHAVVALFPNSYYSPETFRITKSDAADWWNSQFGPLTTVVEWKDFFHFFSKINYISEVSHIAALRKTINVTGNGFVSIFDFDVFVRLFQPWNNILESWKVIVLKHPGCLSYITYEQVVQLLKSFRCYPGSGSYVFRFSCTKPGQWAIGYIDFSGKIYQTIVHNKSLAIALCEGEQAGIYKYPNGKCYDTSLLHKLISPPLQSIIVTLEEHEAYCRIDSSFEICKICAQNNKNIKLEPCGHLLCNFCLTKWQKSFRCQSCPFCRLEIKGIEKISLIPYQTKPENLSKAICECPLVPPRQSSILDSIAKDEVKKELKINYAQLDWMSTKDSGCSIRSYENDESNQGMSIAACNSSIITSEIQSIPNQYPDIHSSINSVNYELPSPHYLNLPNSISNTSTNFSDNQNNLMHITNNSDAMLKLLKITGNDVTMSKEILKHFSPRSLTICSNS